MVAAYALLELLAQAVDWDAWAARILASDGVDAPHSAAVQFAVLLAAPPPALVAEAARLGRPIRLVALAMAARKARLRSRAADRLARSVLGAADAST